MASLDGYSLNEKIDRIQKETQEQLAEFKLMFSELYGYISSMEKAKTKKGTEKCQEKTSAKTSKVKQKATA